MVINEMRYFSFILLILPICFFSNANARDLRVFAAASTVHLIEDLAKSWEKVNGQKVRVVLGSSGALARQMHMGAPADLFFSAAKLWVDYLIREKIADPGSRRTVATNQLVLVAASGVQVPQDFYPRKDILPLLGTRDRIALGDPAHVPAGHYAKQALVSLGLWNKVERRTARARNVRLALALVEQNETPIGIVYRSDVQHRRRVSIIYSFPEKLHSPIEYQIVARKNAASGTNEFLTHLSLVNAHAILRKHGFSPGGT